MAEPAGPSEQRGASDTVRARSAETTAAVFRALEGVDGDVSPQLARSSGSVTAARPCTRDSFWNLHPAVRRR